MMKILLCDDDEETVYAVSRVLKMSGYDCDIARNGIEALKNFEESDYALVLMDIRMPEMDGIEATQKIRSSAKGEKLPVIAFTANSADYPRDKCIDSGMTDLIAKPFDNEELVELVESYLGV